jgi:ATP-binding cassette, subfamily B, bacterial
VKRIRIPTPRLVPGQYGAQRRPERWHRVPVVLQMATADCAPACLAMILGWFRIRTPLSTCRQECSNARDGSTAQDVISAARKLGLDARGLAGPVDALEALPMPVIVHWRNDHFIVVERFSRRTVRLVDPAVGRRTVTREAFATSYSGVVLTFAPQREPARGTPRRRSALLSLLIASLQPIREKLTQILLASLLIQILALSIPAATGLLLDSVVPRNARNLMFMVGVGLITLVLTQFAVEYLRGSVLVFVQRHVDRELMRRLFRHILTLPLKYFEQHKTADLVERLGSTTLVREVLTGQLVSTLLDSVFLIIFLGLLLATDPTTAFVTVLLAAIQAAIVLAVSRRVRLLLHEYLLSQALSQSCLLETLQSIAVVKATGADQRIHQHWSRLFDIDLDLLRRRADINARVDALQTTVRLLSALLLLWLGAWRVIQGDLQIGQMMALIALAMLVLTPVNSLVLAVQRLQSVSAHLARIDDVLEAEPEPDPPVTVDLQELRGRLELRGVSFRYHPKAPLVLENISVVVEAGQKLGVVGPSGCGKSTLGMLLLGLYEASEGEVLVDGHPVANLDRAWLRNQFGVVLQHGGLFSETIHHNVSLGDPAKTSAEIVEAARTAHIHDDIAALPLGYGTTLVEAGGGLSGGQRQRLAIARAVVRRPRVLLLDEATSSLDIVTEAKVASSLRSLTCTQVVVAHRRSTVADADQILVLDGGRMVELGRPEDLVKQRGFYWSLAEDAQPPSPPSRPP